MKRTVALILTVLTLVFSILIITGCDGSGARASTLSGKYILISAENTQSNDITTFTGADLRSLTDGEVYIEFLADNNFILSYGRLTITGTFLMSDNNNRVSLTDEHQDLFHTSTITGEIDGNKITFNVPGRSYNASGDILATFEK